MKAFENNLSIVDIVMRYAIMMVIMILGGALASPALWILGVLVVITAITGYCPVYHMLGINTVAK